MIYLHNGVALLGETGFIGKALARRYLPEGVYFFDSPSSNVLFDENLDQCMEKTINDFLRTIQFCRDKNLYLIYPSSATVYNKNSAYSRCKVILEEIAQAYPVRSLGLRIAAGYGPSESHKGKHASVVYQWCQEMSSNRRPVIFGNGSQTRDFIFEEDIARNIVNLAKERREGIVDIGTGISTSFNEVVALINKVMGKDIDPIYIPKPEHYVEATPVMSVPCDYSLELGINNILLGRYQ